MPKLITFREDYRESTAAIRLLMKNFRGAFSCLSVDYIRKRARVRIVMITRRLSIIVKLDPNNFRRCFWETVRCKFRSGLKDRMDFSDVFKAIISYGNSVLPTETSAFPT